MSDEPQRPAIDDRDVWKVYWQAQGMPWRTEPEIDEERQRFLAECRTIMPDIEQGIYPFKDIKLTRADVEWLLATHESGGMRGPVDWNDPSQRERWGLDLRGADLRGEDLRDQPLVRLRAGLLPWSRGGQKDEWYAATPLQREAAGAHLEGVNLAYTHLEGAVLSNAHLAGANLESIHLESARLRSADLAGASLNGAYFDMASTLSRVNVSNHKSGTASLADVRWNGVNVALVDWAAVKRLGNESVARQALTSGANRKDRATRLMEYNRAVRANRQVAILLRAQGVNEDADRFAYRAQVLQCDVLRRQGQWLRYFGSMLLDLVSGYGYRPLRSVIAYVLIVCIFAGMYLLNAQFAAPHLSWDEALVLSISSFHGRGFFTTGISLGDTLARLAAGEAIIGLLIEITFIATFTQRFFAR